MGFILACTHETAGYSTGGYIYPKENRPIRELLRRRMPFVRQRTAQILSFQTMVSRMTGSKMAVNRIKQLKTADLEGMFDCEYTLLTAQEQIEAIGYLDKVIRRIERRIISEMKLKKEFEVLMTIPGVGIILALTIMLEVGDIRRFEKVGNYSSYCRCVSSIRGSNRKKKDVGNRKNRNKYLPWAYVEAANFSKRFCPHAQKYYQRKAARTKTTRLDWQLLHPFK